MVGYTCISGKYPEPRQSIAQAHPRRTAEKHVTARGVTPTIMTAPTIAALSIPTLRLTGYSMYTLCPREGRLADPMIDRVADPLRPVWTSTSILVVDRVAVLR